MYSSMNSAGKNPYESPTAPPVHHFYPPSPYPGPPPPQPPPPYGPPGTVMYGFQSPPPYSSDPSGYYQGYSPAPHIQPPMPPQGGYGFYPDLSQLQQQPPQVPVTYTGSTYPPVPARPAPPPPGYGAPTPTVPDGGPSTQRCSFAHLKEGEAPPGYVVQWRGGDLQIFFIQNEGHIVSPKKPLTMSIYQKTCVQGNPEGMVEVHGCWRLRLTSKSVPILHTPPDCYTFMDTSTCPSRIVVVQMPSQITKRMSEDLLELLTKLADMRNEEEGVVDKVTTGVATVYDGLTHKLNSAVKETVPSAHKSTKWLRKGTGSIVRIGGNLVARGIHLVADHIPANEKSQLEESPAHTELLNGLQMYKKGLEENTITFVN